MQVKSAPQSQTKVEKSSSGSNNLTKYVTLLTSIISFIRRSFNRPGVANKEGTFNTRTESVSTVTAIQMEMLPSTIAQG